MWEISILDDYSSVDLVLVSRYGIMDFELAFSELKFLICLSKAQNLKNYQNHLDIKHKQKSRMNTDVFVRNPVVQQQGLACIVHPLSG